MGWWWNLTVEWPGAIGDWLYKTLIAMPMETLKDMTVKRIVMALAFIVLVGMFVQFAPIEFAYLFAGDALTYYEAAAILWLLGVHGTWRDVARIFLQIAKRAFRATIRVAGIAAFRRSRLRPRARSGARRLRRFRRTRGSKDHPWRRPYLPGASSGGVWAFNSRRISSVQASSAVSAKLKRLRSA